MCCGQFTSPFLIEQDNEKLLDNLMFYHVVFAMVLFLITCCLAREKPTNPASPSGERVFEELSGKNDEGSHLVSDIINIMFKQKNVLSFWLLTAVLICSQSISLSITSLDGNIAHYLGDGPSVGGAWGSAWAF
eukprot:UN32029